MRSGIARETIEQIVLEVLKRLEENARPKPSLMVIRNGLHEDARMEALKEHYEVFEHDVNRPYTIRPAVSQAVFFDVSQDLVVKGALGIADTAESQLLADMLLQGTNVVFIPSESFEWVCSHTEKQKNQAYANMLFSYKDTLEQFGVVIKPFGELLGQTQSENITYANKLLTQQDVEEYNGSRIVVSKGTIITPLARDLARQSDKVIQIIDS